MTGLIRLKDLPICSVYPFPKSRAMSSQYDTGLANTTSYTALKPVDGLDERMRRDEDLFDLKSGRESRDVHAWRLCRLRNRRN